MYKQYKQICLQNGMVSQFITFRRAREFKNEVACNILKQMNSKLGGDLYIMSFPKELSQRTMILGVDVCHAGPNSIVGFCASINKDLSQYFSAKII